MEKESTKSSKNGLPRNHHSSPLIVQLQAAKVKSSVARSKSTSSSALDVLLLERRVLAGVTAFTAIGFILWVVSVSTDYWFVIHLPNGAAYLNKSQTYFLKSNSGLWRICRTEFRNHSGATAPTLFTMCRYHQLFPSKEEVLHNPQIDRTILRCHRHKPTPVNEPCLDYTRTETAFSIISIFLMIMGFGFSVYTFFEHRYMFKRLAGGVHFLTAATILVVVEVLVNSVNYEAAYLPERHPKGALWSYGFSFFLACFTLSFHIIAGCAFLLFSRKRKGKKAPSELYALADEPHFLGRV